MKILLGLPNITDVRLVDAENYVRKVKDKKKKINKRFYFCKIILHQLIKCYILDMFQLYFTDLIILKNKASVFSAFTFADLTHFTHPSKNLL